MNNPTITKDQFLSITAKNEIEIVFGSYFSSAKNIVAKLKPSSKPRFSKKYNLHKLTLTNLNNLQGAKYYAYLRGDKVNFAYSDSPIYIEKIEIK